MKTKTTKELSVYQSDSGLSQNRQFTPQISAGFDSRQEDQNYLNNFTFAHLSNQDNHDTGATADIKAENVTKAAVKTQQNSLVFDGKIEDGVVRSAGKSGFSDGQDVNPGLPQTQNNVAVDTLVNKNFKHSDLSRLDFQDFLFTQDPGRITEGDLGVLNRNPLVLSGNVVKTVTPLEKVENVDNSNPRALDTGLAESNLLFDGNTGGSGHSDSIVHEGNYNSSVRNLSNSQWVIIQCLPVKR